ncbi:MAG TPA: DUF2161 family putative PD-(D/E)XK-type phosphodiesterase, partial [Spirochaetia bacterium]|nr:DUF2161 family putative PD-(D/E)XK-type phosphodiesterase [Spirochaetia bacterium]
MKLAKKATEADLYQPVSDFLVRNGYTVRSEVNGCDITATKDNELVIIELKLNFTTSLLIQATQRQRMTDSVYIGIPRPVYGLGTRKGRQMSHLVRRLELGLIIVDLIAEEVEVVFHPLPFERKRDNRARRSLLREIDGRSGEYNVGGSTRTQLVTAYRENAIMIACLLKVSPTLSPKELRDRGAGKNTQSILRNNHYGWFERVDRGL